MSKQKEIVIFFSHSGNTRRIAEEISKQGKADIFELIPLKKYPQVYRDCTDVAAIEKKQLARPGIAINIENLHEYDLIYLGFPNWWSTMPMIVLSFLETHDLRGKVIRPFVTHGGGGLANCLQDMQAHISSTVKVMKPLCIHDIHIQSAVQDVCDWLYKVE